MIADHSVTVEWDHHGWPRYSFTCAAPADAMCRAQFQCECESYGATGTNDGHPWHTNAYDEDPEPARHYGTFGAEECNLADWFDNCDETMRGSVTFAVAPEWDGDMFTFSPLGGAL